MKSWALVLILMAAVITPSQNAEAKKAPKHKVVIISFSESDLKQNRGPASVDDQKEMDAEARHEARLAEVTSYSIPEM